MVICFLSSPIAFAFSAKVSCLILSTSAGFTLEIMYVRSGICCECFWLQVLLCSLSLYLGCRLIMLFFLALLRVASCVLLFRRGHEPNTLMQLRNVEEVRFVDCNLGWIQRAKQFVLYDTLIYIQLYDCHICSTCEVGPFVLGDVVATLFCLQVTLDDSQNGWVCQEPGAIIQTASVPASSGEMPAETIGMSVTNLQLFQPFSPLQIVM